MKLRSVVPAFLALIACGTIAQAQHRSDHLGPARSFGTPTSRAHSQQYEYSFGGRDHQQRLASEMRTQANNICWEMHREYRRNEGWNVTYREMYDLLGQTKHLQQLVRDGYRSRNNEDHIADDLHEMDKLFHHIEEDIANWRPDNAGRRDRHDRHGRRFDDRRDSRDYYRGGRGSRGDDLPRLMARFEDSLHHMMTDYGVRSRLANREGDTRRDSSGRRGEAPPPLP